MSSDYYYNYDPNMNLTFADDVYYGNFQTEVDLYNRAVRAEKERQVKKVRFQDEMPEEHKKNMSKTTQKAPMNKHQQIYLVNKKQQTEGESMFNTSMLCVLIFFVILFTMWRYGLLGWAIDKGQTLPALALLSPEIGNAVYLAAL